MDARHLTLSRLGKRPFLAVTEIDRCSTSEPTPLSIGAVRPNPLLEKILPLPPERPQITTRIATEMIILDQLVGFR